MNIKYFGTSIPLNDIPAILINRGVNLSGAARKREMYLLNIFSQIINIKNFQFITPSYGKNVGFFKLRKLHTPKISYFFLGYFGKGVLRILTSHIYSFIWIIKNVKAGDVIITYNFPPIYAIPLLLKKFFTKFRLIIEFEDLYNRDDNRYYFFRPFELLGIKYADDFIASSMGMSNYIINKRTNAKIIINGGYFENVNLLKNKNKYAKSNILRMLYSGTLDKERGIHNLIKLFEFNNSKKFQLFFSGSGPLEDYIKEKSKKDKRIKFCGLLNEIDYKILVNNSHVCINPQWTSISVNFPSKITMYLSHGKIVLSTKIKSLINSPYKDLLFFYDESNSVDFWNNLNLIYESRENLTKNIKFRKNKFERIINAQKLDLIKLISE